jgi:hypothetical protein
MYTGALIHPTVLGFLNYDLDISSHVCDFKKTKNIDYVREIASETFFKIVRPYYSEQKLEVNIGTFNFLVEPLKNANFYGSNSIDNVLFRILLSKYGFIASYNDGGSYFRRSDVKSCWENRTIHPEKHPKLNDAVGFGIGTGLVYSVADLIFVDTDNATLYTGISTKNNIIFK